MSLRIGFDMDGVLADFEAAYRLVELRLFGAEAHHRAVPQPESAPDAEKPPAETQKPTASNRRRTRIWREIEETPNFWRTLDPIDATVIPRLNDLAGRYRWEIFFITQRPETAGETVQRQTQRWLTDRGFELPSVAVLKRSRGKLAEALHLDFMVDDSAKNCVDIISESSAKAILVLRHEREHHTRPQKARNVGIGVAASIAACLDLLEEIENVRSNPTLLERVAKLVGWKPNARGGF
jgi:hypothetical protein